MSGVYSFLIDDETFYSAHRPMERFYVDPPGARPIQEVIAKTPALAILKWIDENQTRIIPGEWIFYLANQLNKHCGETCTCGK